MKLSISTVYKWAESRTRGSASGIRNPLDRGVLLHKVTNDQRVISRVCTEADGYFIGWNVCLVGHNRKGLRRLPDRRQQGDLRRCQSKAA